VERIKYPCVKPRFMEGVACGYKLKSCNLREWNRLKKLHSPGKWVGRNPDMCSRAAQYKIGPYKLCAQHAGAFLLHEKLEMGETR